MGLATTRGPGWPDSATAGEELQKVAKMIGSDRSIEASIGSVAHMPTMAQLRSAGRKDLVYAVQKFGYYEMAQAARLEVPRRRGRLAKV